MIGTAPRIIVKYDYSSPIDLLDLTGSLTAFAEQFHRFAANNPIFSKSAEPRLQVAAMRQGSIIAELIPWAKQVDWVLDHKDAAIAVLSQWQELLGLLVKGGEGAKSLDKPAVRSAVQLLEPVAKDGGAQINLVANDGGVNYVNVTINNIEANAAQSNARRILAGDLSVDDGFVNEPMALFQFRDAVHGKVGDLAKMDRYGSRPIKLTWGDDAVKESILTQPDNPFALIFWVSGRAKSVNGKVVGLHITALESTTAREGD